MQCLILAGGLGTRIRGVAGDVPKSMIPVRGRPFIDHQLSRLRAGGVEQVVLSIGHLGDMIRSHVGDGKNWGLDVHYTEDGPTLLGTAGAIRKAIDDETVSGGLFVLYGDSYLRVDLPSVWKASGFGKAPLMTVFRNEGQWDQSNVIMNGGRIELFEKGRPDTAEIGMTHIDYGLSVMTEKAICSHVEPGAVADLADVCHRLSLSGELRAFEATQRFYEIGSPAGLIDLEDYLSGAEHE